MKSTQLLLDRRFWPFFWTQFLGAFNDNFLKNAFVMLMVYGGIKVLGIDAEMMSPLAAALFILPFFLFSALAGQIADKYEKTRIIRAVKVFEIILMIGAAIGFLFGQYTLMLGVILFMGIHSTFFGPIKYSILPQLLREDELVAGNALVEMGTNLAILLGTIAGGVLIALGEAGRKYVAVILIGAALTGWLLSRLVPRAKASAPELEVSLNPIMSTIGILRSVRRVKSVHLSVLGISWFWLFGVAFLALLPLYAKYYLHAGESVVTLFLSLFCVGIAVGSVICEKLSFGRLELGLVPIGSFGMSVFAADLFFAGTSGLPVDVAGYGAVELLRHVGGIRIATDLFLLAVCGGFFIVPLYTLVQERSQAGERSRVIAGNNVLNALFMVMGSLLTMAMLALDFNAPQMFLTIAIANALVAVYIYTVIPEFMIRFMSYLLSRVLYRVRAQGWEKIPSTGAAVLVCNHVAFIDWLIIAATVKRPLRFVMDHSFMNIPVLGIFFRHAKIIPIASAKENPALLEKAFERIAEELADGEMICIFPEGRLTPDGTMQAFRPGIEKIIGRTPVPVYPMALSGLWGSFFSRKDGKAFRGPFRRFWSRIGLTIGEPILPVNVTAAGLQQEVARLLGE